MTFDTINIDLTSRSKTYNPIGPQGQWIYHRFGKRNYPIKDLPISHVKKILNSLKDQTIFLESFYGDTLEYDKLLDVIKLCDKNNLHPFIFTYGSHYNEEQLKEICNYNVRFYVKNYGIDSNSHNIVENFNTESFLQFLKITKKKTIIEFQTYQHNINQIPNIIDLCVSYNIELKISKGVTYDENLSNVINSKGEWLYDIFALDFDLPYENDFLISKSGLLKCKNAILNLLASKEVLEKYRSVIGRRKLLKYIKNQPNNKTILKSPTIPEINNFNLEVDQYKNDNSLYINFLGYAFPNKHFYEIFNNAICNDWYDDYLEYVDTYTTSVSEFSYMYIDNYVHSLSGPLKRLSEIEKNNLNIRKNNLDSLKENFLDCFGYRYI